MLTYRLVNNLKQSEYSDWQGLVLESLGPDVHPNRQKGFCLGREALRECLKTLSFNLKVGQLHLEDYRTLKNFPDYTLSISHTSEWGAAVIGKSSQFLSVGIDIEPEDREVKEVIIKRISHPNDAKLKPIVLWSLKEATFKALMNTGRFKHNEEFSSICITEEGWSHPPSGLCGLWQTEIYQGVIVALAWIKT